MLGLVHNFFAISHKSSKCHSERTITKNNNTEMEKP